MNEVFLPEGIARAIQLAIAPVFLLTAIGTLLGVMTTRLHRIIDRARVWEASWKASTKRRKSLITSRIS